MRFVTNASPSYPSRPTSETVAEMAARLGIRIPEPSTVKTQRCGRCETSGLIWDEAKFYYYIAATHEIHSCPKARLPENAYKAATWKRGRERRRNGKNS
jgi:hypothetical protein